MPQEKTRPSSICLKSTPDFSEVWVRDRIAGDTSNLTLRGM
jgi:hypothetical protein